MEGGTVTYVLPAQPVVYGHINARSPACEIARMAVQPPTLLQHLKPMVQSVGERHQGSALSSRTTR